MSIEEVTTVNWAERIKQSFAGIGSGAALVALTVSALFWNEGRAVQTARSLSEGAGLVVERPSDQLDPAYHNQLVHVAGQTSAEAALEDGEFGLAFEGLRLARKVEMFQWVQNASTEKSGNAGGSETHVTTYTYAPAWRESWQNSTEFKEPAGHMNPEMRFGARVQAASGAKLGAYALDAEVIELLGAGKPVSLTEDQLAVVRDTLGYRERAELHNGALFLGRSAQNPSVGDYRITYSLVPFDTISVAGRQHETGLGRYRTDSGDAILLVERGNLNAKDMFATAQSSNNSTTWLIRVAALFVMILGFGLIFKPLSVLASVLPFLGAVVGFGTNIIATILGLGLGSVVIAIAWAVHRPVLSVVILGLGLAVISGLIVLGRRRRAAALDRDLAPKSA